MKMPQTKFAAKMQAAMQAMNTGMDDAPMNGNPDHDFASMMIPHHKGAIAMAQAEIADGKNPQMLALARGIVASQNAQVTEMQRFLDAGVAKGSRFCQLMKAFNANQPRDKDGRFTSGASQVGATGKSTEFKPGSTGHTNAVGGAPLKSWTPPAGTDDDENAGWRAIKDVPGADPSPLKLPAGKKAASGVIVHEPDGRVWLTKPTNAYGGYKYTFPKGSAEPDLSLQQNAIKEAYEETGLHVAITGHAGDYERDTSVGRYYHAKRIGGHPGDAGWEAEGVTLAHPDDMHSLLNKPVDQKIAHEQAGAPTPPKGKTGNESATWWDNFKAGKTPKVTKALTFAQSLVMASNFGDELAKDFNPKEARGKDGKWVSGGASFTPSTDTSGWKQDHLGAINSQKFMGKITAIANHPSMTTSEKLTALMNTKLPKGGNSYQNAKIKTHGEAMAYVKGQLESEKASNAGAEKPKSDGILDTSGWKKTGNQLGSNSGGVFTDGTGQKWYVKTPKSDDAAKSEVLAGHLYNAMGVKTLEPQLVKTAGGKLGVATKWNDDIKTVAQKGGVNALNAAQKHDVQSNFAAHALLANWDAAGAEHDNQGFDKDGKAVTVDGGGSLAYRAQGESKGKLWNSKANEWDTMRDSSVNPQSADMFGDMTASKLKDSADKAASLTPDKITDLVNKYGPGTDADKDKLASTLIARQNAIQSKAASLTPEPKAKPEAKEPTTLEEHHAATAAVSPQTAENIKYLHSAGDKELLQVVHDHAGKDGKAYAAAALADLNAKTPNPTTLAEHHAATGGALANIISNAHAAGDTQKLQTIATHGVGAKKAYAQAALDDLAAKAPKKPADAVSAAKEKLDEATQALKAAHGESTVNTMQNLHAKGSIGVLHAVADSASSVPEVKAYAQAALAHLDAQEAAEKAKGQTDKPKEPEASRAPAPAAEQTKATPTKTAPAMPSPITADKLSSPSNPLSQKLWTKAQAVNQVAEDYKAGKINAADAHAKLQDTINSLGKQSYHKMLAKHAANVMAAINTHEASGSVPADIKTETQEQKADAFKPHTPKKKPFDPSQITAPPSFKNWHGKGQPGPSSSQHVNDANEAATQAIYEAAKTGKPEAVENLKAPTVDKKTGEVTGETPVLSHPSQHVKGYAQQTLGEIDQQLNPPKQWRPTDGDAISAMHESFPPVKDISGLSASQKKYSKFVHLGEVGQGVKNEDLGITPDMTKSLKNGGIKESELVSKTNAAWEKMPETQKQALKNYTGSGYTSQNKGLWAGNPNAAAKAAASAIHTYGQDLPVGTTLSRKFTPNASEMQMLKGAEGHIIQEPAIMSTAIKPSVWSGSAQFKLTAGPGVKGLYIDPHSSNEGEKEMLLPPNTRLLITKVDSDPVTDKDGFGEGVKHVIHATILPTV